MRDRPAWRRWVWSRYVRARRAELSEQAEHDLQEQAQRAVMTERTRIVRELHDVVAHHMSVMVIQAGAARQLLDESPEDARRALAAVEEAGRQGLSAMPGLLRAEGNGGVRAPQPTLDELDQLVTQARAAGLPVDVRLDGSPRPLPPGIDLSAYRVVQEALTNTRKHAGPARAEVVIRYDPTALEVAITDDGYGVVDEPRGGHGLLGMRERVTVFGGELHTGPRPGGGYAVTARFPIR